MSSNSPRVVLDGTAAQILAMVSMSFSSLESFVGLDKIVVAQFCCLLSILTHAFPMSVKLLWKMHNEYMNLPWKTQIKAIIKDILAVFLQQLVLVTIVVDDVVVVGVQEFTKTCFSMMKMYIKPSVK